MTSKKLKFNVNYTHFGEVIQGVFTNISKQKCALSFPMSLNTKKKKQYIKKSYFNDNLLFSNAFCFSKFKSNKKLILKPKKFKKAKLLLENIAERYPHKKITGQINIVSNISKCRGLGSSTSTLVSLILLIKYIFKIKISNEEALRICALIEPTDPILIKDNCLFSTKEGIIKRRFNFKFPRMIIYGFDTDPKGKGINTTKMKDINYTRKELNFFSNTFKKLKNMKFYSQKSIEKISKKSLSINQKYYPKKNFRKILEFEKKLTNDFILGAHSGTMVGFVYRYSKLSGEKFKKNNDLEILKNLAKTFKSKIVKYLYV